MNIQSIILIAVLILAAVLAIIFAVKHKTVIKCAGCNGDCEHCHGNLPSETEAKYKQSLIDGKNTPIEECFSENDLAW